MDETLDNLGKTIADALHGTVIGYWVGNGELTVTAAAGDIVKLVSFLRDDERCQFVSLIDVTAVDWPARPQRFEVVYHLLSPKLNRRIRIKTIKNIAAGDEITYDYGKDYFNAYIKPHGCQCDKCRKKRAEERAEARARNARKRKRAERLRAAQEP